MSAQYKTRRQIKEARMVIVAECYKKGMSIRKIAREVEARFGLAKPPSTQTIFKDIQSLLEEWRSTRIEDVDMLIQLELERIDDTIQELWQAWEKSKTDSESVSEKKKGAVKGEGKVSVSQIEKTVKEEIKTGDVRYISEIRAQLMERRKLLGLYAPEKINHEGSLGIMFNEIIDDGTSKDDTDH